MTMLLIGFLFLAAVAVAFVARGPYRAQVTPEPGWEVPGSDVRRGKVAIQRHGCGSCHVIPGIRGANARVGPRLEGLIEQSYIGGVLPNEPEYLVSWIQDPQAFSPRTAMPDLGVTPQEARDIAAYLYSQ